MTTSSGAAFPRIIDAHKVRTGVSDSELARRIGISRQNLYMWRTDGLKALPAADHLEALAHVTEVPYEVVLEAALGDIGYLPPKALVLNDCLDPLIRTSGSKFAIETVRLRERGCGMVGIGTGTVRVLSRLWLTAPRRAISFLSDYLTTLRVEDPSITWAQVEKGLWVEFGGLLTIPERDAFLLTAKHDLSFIVDEMPTGEETDAGTASSWRAGP